MGLSAHSRILQNSVKILACYSIKGGVGKTALAVNLAVFLQKKSLKVLLVDLDAQGSAGFYFHAFQSEKFHGDDSDKLASGLAENIRPTRHRGLDVIPAHLAYRKLDLWLHQMKKSRGQLRKILHHVGNDYQAVILDCPPGITLLSESIFRASDLLLVPVIPTPLSVRTYEMLLHFFKKEELPNNRIAPFFSMVQHRRLHREVMEELRRRDAAFLRATIPHSSTIEKMGLSRRPLLAGNSQAPPVLALRELCGEVWERASVLL